ncbi:MAG: fumarate hydratase, class II [Deltaproteobacteria bacterium]|nr:MAG: fumarate hydratase, class II [Deltaproteobacteria bacterium]
MDYRTEHDTMGEVQVPADKLWGAQTQRSVNNFAIGQPGSMPREVIKAFACLKKAAAMTNADLGILPAEKAKLIGQVCDEIVAGKLDEHFPLVVWQTGSGTHTNMNLNEVIANRGQQLLGKSLVDDERVLHPNDHVNRSQSSNDTFPTAMHIAASMVLRDKTIPALEKLYVELREKSEEFAGITKIGRTHLMDATPLTLGQEFSGYAHLIYKGLVRLKESLKPLHELALGGTAVGTGINCPAGFQDKVAYYIAYFTDIYFVTASNKFEALSAHDSLVNTHGALRQLAVSLHKIGHDLRMLASGPRCGLGEIILPANEPGSSIMPGKVNPSQIEALTMVCGQVIGNDVAIGFGAANGHFELNVFKPMIIDNFLQSANLMGDMVKSFYTNCLIGIQANEAAIANYLDQSLMLVTALTPHIGYEKAAQIAKTAFKNNTTLKEETLKLVDNVDEAKVEEWLNPAGMLGK